MRKTAILMFVALGTFLLSCKGEKKEEGDKGSLMKEVMAIHDEVMPEMGKVGKLVGRLKGMVDSTAQGQRYEKAMKDLQASHAGMMDWMKDFGNQFDSDEILNGKPLSAEKQQLLLEEKGKIKAVSDKIYVSIRNAEAVLGEGQ